MRNSSQFNLNAVVKALLGRARQILLLGLALLLVSCQTSPTPGGVAVKVEQVLNGQLVEVSLPTGSGTVERIRLSGIEAPDLEQLPWGQQAKQRLEELLMASPDAPVLRLETLTQETDRANQKWAYLWRGKTLINQQVVEEGLALALSPSSDGKYAQRLADAQEKARLMGLGIWDPKSPMRQTPDQFRAQSR